jgi:hypothetical protein
MLDAIRGDLQSPSLPFPFSTVVADYRFRRPPNPLFAGALEEAPEIPLQPSRATAAILAWTGEIHPGRLLPSLPLWYGCPNLFRWDRSRSAFFVAASNQVRALVNP